jgi:hypothetical protein
MTEPAWKQFLTLKSEAPAQAPSNGLKSALVDRKRKRSTQNDSKDTVDQNAEVPKRLGKRHRDFLASQQETAKRTAQATRQRAAAQGHAAHQKREEAERRAAVEATQRYLEQFLQAKTGEVVTSSAAAPEATEETKVEELSERKRLKLAKKEKKAARRAQNAGENASQRTLPDTAVPSWKFSKQRQNHILRQLYSVEDGTLFPADEESDGRFTRMCVPYLKEIQGASRERVLSEARTIVEKYESQQATKEEKPEVPSDNQQDEEEDKGGEKEEDKVSETVSRRAQQIIEALA